MTTPPLLIFGLVVALVVTAAYVLNNIGRYLALPEPGKASEVFVAALIFTQAPTLFILAVFSPLALTTDQRVYMCVGAITMFGSSLRSVVRRFTEKPQAE